jgi:hypothetical protein
MTYNGFGAITPSMDGDEHEDLTGGYYGNLVIYFGGNFIDTIPKFKFLTCPKVTNVCFGDINLDNISDIICFDDGNPDFDIRGCLSVVLGNPLTSISESQKLSPFSLKTFKTNSSHFTISFTLLKESRATFSLFDMEGKLVKVLKEGMFDAGEQSFTWDSGDMPQGVYFLRLTANGQTQTEKIIIE